MSEKQPQTSRKKQANSILKYSGAAFQLLAPILIFAFIGQYLDKRYLLERPYLTVVFSLLGLATGLYLLIKEILNDPK